jgi:hypothetical protein
VSWNPNRRTLTCTSLGCQNFPHPLRRHRHSDRLHGAAAGSTPLPSSARPSPPCPVTESSHSSFVVVALLLLRHTRDHVAASLTPATVVSAVPGNRAIRSAITAVGSMPPSHHRHTRELCHPPDRHRRRVHLHQFGKPSPSLFYTPSINSILLCLDICLYEYA